MRFILTLALVVSLFGISGCQTPTYRVRVFQSGQQVVEFTHEGDLHHLATGAWFQQAGFGWTGLDLRVPGRMTEVTVIASDGVIVAERIYPEE